MEAEVVRMVVNLFNGDDECCGLVNTILITFSLLRPLCGRYYWA